MADSDRIDSRYRIEFIHNSMADFYKQILEYFSTYLYPRFEWKVVTTYEKAVEYLSKKGQYGRETDQPMLPALVLSPNGDFGVDESYGKMLWRFPNLQPGFLKRLMSPIYQDSNVIIDVGFTRFVGEAELIALFGSFYEYMDLRVYLNLIFGGPNRYIYPFWMNSYIILPSDVYDFKYENQYTGESYTIQIPTITNKLIRTTNKNEVVFPFRVLPRFKLTGNTDASSRLGGADKLPDWRLNFTIEYEIEIPTYVVIQTDYLVENFSFNIKFGSYYTVNNDQNNNEPVVADMIENDYHLDFQLQDGTASTIVYPSEAELTKKKEKQIKTRYYHIVSQAEADTTSNVDITLPEPITDQDLLVLYGKHGTFSYGVHYTLSIDGWTLTIIKQNVTLTVNDVIELYVYHYIYESP